MLLPASALADTAAFTIGSKEYVLNGQSMVMDVAPYLKNNRTYIPIRYAATAAGVASDSIFWNEAEKTVVLLKGDRVVKLKVGSKTLILNGVNINMDAAPEIASSRVMLPLRYVAQALGSAVYWDLNTKTAILGDNIEARPASRYQPAGSGVVPSLVYDASVGTVSKIYTWQYNGRSFQWQVEVPVQLLDYNKEVSGLRDRYYGSNGQTQYRMLAAMDSRLKNLILACSTTARGNLVPWVMEESNYRYAGFMAERLAAQAEYERYNYFHKAEFAASFVGGAIPYNVRDTQLPASTLAESGDCDCKSLLLAAILKNMGYDVALLSYPNHMALGIAFTDQQLPPGQSMSYYNYNGTKYYFIETTTPGWQIGQVSEESNKQAVVYPVN